MKKLLVIAYHFPPCALSGTYRTLAWVRLLAQRGWDITVVTVKNPESPLDYELLKKIPNFVKILRAPYINPLEILGKLKKSNHSPSHFSRLTSHPSLLTPHISPLTPHPSPLTPHVSPLTSHPSPLTPHPSRFTSHLSHLKDWLTWWLHIPDNHICWLPFGLLKAIKAIKKHKISIIYSTSPYMTAHLIAGLAKKITKIPWVADFRDPWRANPFRNIPYKILNHWDSILEAWTVKQANHIICVTEYMKNDFINRYPFIKNKISYIPNGYDPEDYENLKPIREFDKDFFVITHTGTFYGPRSPIPIFKALNLLKKQLPDLAKKLRLQLIGNPTYNGERLEEIADKFNITEMVKVISTVPKYKALCYLKGSDALLLVGFKGKGAEMQVPAKLYEYFAIKKPIFVLAPLKSAIADIFYVANPPGEICEPDNIPDITDKLAKIMKNQYQPSPQIEKFNRHNLVIKLETILNRLNNLTFKNNSTANNYK